MCSCAEIDSLLFLSLTLISGSIHKQIFFRDRLMALFQQMKNSFFKEVGDWQCNTIALHYALVKIFQLMISLFTLVLSCSRCEDETDSIVW